MRASLLSVVERHCNRRFRSRRSGLRLVLQHLRRNRRRWRALEQQFGRQPQGIQHRLSSLPIFGQRGRDDPPVAIPSVRRLVWLRQSPLQQDIGQGIRVARNPGQPITRCCPPDQVQAIAQHPQPGTGHVDRLGAAPQQAPHGVQQILFHRHTQRVLSSQFPPGSQVSFDAVAVGGGEEFHQWIGAIGHPNQCLEQRRHQAGVDDSLAAVDELLTTALTELSDRHETLAQQLRQQGATPPTYSQPLSYAMAITSPRGRRFLEVLQTADRYAQQVDGLWLCEALDDLARASALLWARRHLVKVAVGIVQLGARTHTLSWFYQQDAGVLKQLADVFQSEQLAWGRDGYLYRPSTDEEARVALRFPLALPDDDADQQQALLAAWAERGWLRTRTPQMLAPDLRLLVLSREVSGHFLVAAGVSRSQWRRLAEQHQALLLARLAPDASSASSTSAKPPEDTKLAA